MTTEWIQGLEKTAVFGGNFTAGTDGWNIEMAPKFQIIDRENSRKD